MISDKLRQILQLTQEIQGEAAVLAKKAGKRSVQRFFETEYGRGTSIGNIADHRTTGFDALIERAEAYERLLGQQKDILSNEEILRMLDYSLNSEV